MTQKRRTTTDGLSNHPTPLPNIRHFCYNIGMTSYNKLYDIAADNYGLITNAQAHGIGVSTRNLNDMARRGRLVRIGYGVYQLSHYIPTELDSYAQAVALAGPGAFLYGESVLAILNLAPTNPTRMYIGTPGRMRRRLGEGYRVRQFFSNARIRPIEGIAAQDVSDAILAAAATVRRDRLEAAAEEAFRRGLITTEERKRIAKELNRGKQPA